MRRSVSGGGRKRQNGAVRSYLLAKVCVCVSGLGSELFPPLGSDLLSAVKPRPLHHTVVVKSHNECVGGGPRDQDLHRQLEVCVCEAS